MSARELVEAARAALRAGDVDGALAAFTSAAQRSPDDPDAWFGAGVCRAQRGEFDRAVDHFERALTLAPSAPPQLLLALANALHDGGRGDDALARAAELTRRHPQFAAGWNALGSAWLRAGRADEASTALREAIRIDPGYWRAAANLAPLAAERGELEAAAASYERWGAGEPASFAAVYGLARVRHRQARVVEAIEAYRHALALDPGHADAHNDLGNAYTDIAEVELAQAAFRRALEIRPDYAEVHSNLLLNRHYGANVAAGAIFAEHRAWASRHAPMARIALPPRRDSARIHVGLVAASFGGAVGCFVEPLLAHVDRDRFDVACYVNHGSRDETSQRIARHAQRLRDISALSDGELAALIVADGIDIVVDLAGHTPGNRLRAMARKPATVVVTWLDYFDTTGVDAVDYLLADAIAVPDDSKQQFSEQVIRFAPCRLCYAPPADAPAVGASPSLARGHVTFGSFNRLSKLSPAVRALWARILAAVPDSRLLLKNAAFVDPQARALFARHFAALGVPASRLELRPASAHAMMLAEYGDVDIALDPFPYNGGVTTCEALWMGVPVVCLAGDSMISRQSASLASAAGLARFIAKDADDYVAIAVDWSRRRDARAELRSEMRERVRTSTLCDAPAFARRWERALADALRK